jgi:hypothetical protein
MVCNMGGTGNAMMENNVRIGTLTEDLVWRGKTAAEPNETQIENEMWNLLHADVAATAHI